MIPMKKSICYIVIVLLGITSYGQNMEEGFQFLENGNWEQATVYFKKVLSENPKNTTAKLCYGRAIGLNGNSQEAQDIFSELILTDKQNLEFKLNYAESLLWNKNYTKAVPYYDNLVRDNPTNFAAVLGYANALSSVKEYKKALQQVHAALQINPDNANALLSRKYIRLGRAAQLIEENKYQDAETLLLKNFNSFPEDLDTKLNLITIYFLKKDLNKAEKVYRSISDSIIQFTGLSLVFHKKNQNKKALYFAEKAIEKTRNIKDTSKQSIAEERLIQALIWNGKFKKAKTKISEMEFHFPNSDKTKALQATLYMYTGTFKKAIAQYNLMLQKDSTSFDANLGLANAYRALGEKTKALASIEKTLSFYKNQPDALQLKRTITLEMAPNFKSQYAISEDNGNNRAQSFGITGKAHLTEKIALQIDYTQRTTENPVTNSTAENNFLSIGSRIRLYENIYLNGKLGYVKATTNINEYSGVHGEVSLQGKPLAKQFIELKYKRELQDFNASLVEEKIFMNHYTLNYNMGTNFGLGWYTSLMFTSQTDTNSRNLLFSSLYYNISKKPGIKTGINYQYLSFKEQVPNLYFSPSKYQAFEAFGEVSTSFKNISFFANGAVGYQFVEEENKTSLLRLEARTRYTFNNQISLGFYGKYSNIASETATGFEFKEVGIQLSWFPSKKPIYKLPKS